MRFFFTCFIICFVSEIFAAPDTSLVQNYLNDQIDNKNVFGVQISFLQNDFLWNTSAGNLKPEDPVFIASTTKLFISAITLKYITDGVLKFSDPIRNYLPEEVMNNLHTFNSQDYADSITIQHLLAHTSGLPDYFGDKPVGKKTSLMEDLFEGKDMEWTAEYAIELSKTMVPHFAPGTPEKAYYSDTNFQLLSMILEKISGKKIADLLKEKITQPLGMKSTYMYPSKDDITPRLFYYKKEHLKIPLAMSSFGADGGMVSTSSDMLIFLNAFFNGAYFPKEKLSELYVWNKIMFPLNNGVGMMMAKFPGTPMFIGHSGHSGAFAFYVPDKNLYVAGTVNQVDKPETSFKMLAKMMRFF